MRKNENKMKENPNKSMSTFFTNVRYVKLIKISNFSFQSIVGRFFKHVIAKAKNLIYVDIAA